MDDTLGNVAILFLLAGVKSFSKSNIEEEVQKGKATKDQLGRPYMSNHNGNGIHIGSHTCANIWHAFHVSVCSEEKKETFV